MEAITEIEVTEVIEHWLEASVQQRDPSWSLGSVHDTRTLLGSPSHTRQRVQINRDVAVLVIKGPFQPPPPPPANLPRCTNNQLVSSASPSLRRLIWDAQTADLNAPPRRELGTRLTRPLAPERLTAE